MITTPLTADQTGYTADTIQLTADRTMQQTPLVVDREPQTIVVAVGELIASHSIEDAAGEPLDLSDMALELHLHNHRREHEDVITPTVDANDSSMFHAELDAAITQRERWWYWGLWDANTLLASGILEVRFAAGAE